MNRITAFQIHRNDNVATLLEDVQVSQLVVIGGESSKDRVVATEDILSQHKIAIRDIAEGEEILKYGLSIGQSTRDIQCGDWVHLHNMKSNYDIRSATLDLVTGATKDMIYE